MSQETKKNSFVAEKCEDDEPERVDQRLVNDDALSIDCEEAEVIAEPSPAVETDESDITEETLERVLQLNIHGRPRKCSHPIPEHRIFLTNCRNAEEGLVGAVRKCYFLESIIVNGDSRLAEMLLDKGSRLTPWCCKHLLHIAIENNAIDLARSLLNRGADVDARNSKEMTPLHVATMKKYLPIAEMLLDNGADIHATIYDRNKRAPKVSARTVDPNKLITMRSFKTITQPAGISMEDIKTYVYDYPTTGSNFKGSVINFAIRNGDLPMTKMLLRKGADQPHNPDILSAVIGSGNLSIIECFIKRNIDINGKGENGETALHHAVLATQPEFLKVLIVKLLRSRGACVHAKNVSGQTPLHLAAQRGNAMVVKALLEFDPDERDTSGCKFTICHSSYPQGQWHTSRTLANRSKSKDKIDAAKPGGSDEKDCGKSAETLPERGLNKDDPENSEDRSNGVFLVEDVLGFRKKAALLHAKNNFGETPLHVASAKNHKAVVEMLLRHGTDNECRTIFGKSAVDIAFENGCRQAFVALLKYGSDIDIAYIASVPDRYRPTFCLIKSDRGEFIISNKYCVESITKHIVRMKAAGRAISKGNLECLTKHKEMLIDYQRECIGEIEKMKREKVGRNVSLYDVLLTSGNQSAVYARNETLIRTLLKKNFKKRYPIYSNMIRYNLMRGQVRDVLMDIALNSFNSLIDHSLPPEVVVGDIFKHLANEDLDKLIEACDKR